MEISIKYAWGLLLYNKTYLLYQGHKRYIYTAEKLKTMRKKEMNACIGDSNIMIWQRDEEISYVHKSEVKRARFEGDILEIYTKKRKLIVFIEDCML